MIDETSSFIYTGNRSCSELNFSVQTLRVGAVISSGGLVHLGTTWLFKSLQPLQATALANGEYSTWS